MAVPVTHSLPGFLRGLCFPFLGLRFVYENPRFWRYLLWPTLLNGLITAICLAGFGYAAWEVSVYARIWIPETWWGYALRVLFYVGLGGLTVALVLAVSLLVGAGVTSTFRGVLADRVERFLGTPAKDLPGLSVAQEVSEAFLAVRDIGLMAVLLFAVSLVPAFGPVLSFAGGWYWNAYTLGLESLDTPWALRGLNRDAKRLLARTYRGETLGIGTVALVLGWIPLVGSFVMSLAVVGSVLWYFDAVARQTPKR